MVLDNFKKPNYAKRTNHSICAESHKQDLASIALVDYDTKLATGLWPTHPKRQRATVISNISRSIG